MDELREFDFGGTDPDLISPDEAGEIWGVQGKTVRKWAKEGKLPYIRLPSGRFKFRRSEMMELLTLNRVGATVDKSDDLDSAARAGYAVPPI